MRVNWLWLALHLGRCPVDEFNCTALQAGHYAVVLKAEAEHINSEWHPVCWKKRITLIGGGSYLRIQARKIEYGTTSDCVRKMKRTYLGAFATMPTDLPSHDKVADLPPVLNAFSFS